LCSNSPSFDNTDAFRPVPPMSNESVRGSPRPRRAGTGEALAAVPLPGRLAAELVREVERAREVERVGEADVSRAADAVRPADAVRATEPPRALPLVVALATPGGRFCLPAGGAGFSAAPEGREGSGLGG
jgi:hypothetical protein